MSLGNWELVEGDTRSGPSAPSTRTFVRSLGAHHPLRITSTYTCFGTGAVVYVNTGMKQYLMWAIASWWSTIYLPTLFVYRHSPVLYS
ncbi:hypothetical protein V8F06_002468 [Rhypophila decipiens]